MIILKILLHPLIGRLLPYDRHIHPWLHLHRSLDLQINRGGRLKLCSLEFCCSSVYHHAHVIHVPLRDVLLWHAGYLHVFLYVLHVRYDYFRFLATTRWQCLPNNFFRIAIQVWNGLLLSCYFNTGNCKQRTRSGPFVYVKPKWQVDLNFISKLLDYS